MPLPLEVLCRMHQALFYRNPSILLEKVNKSGQILTYSGLVSGRLFQGSAVNFNAVLKAVLKAAIVHY